MRLALFPLVILVTAGLMPPASAQLAPGVSGFSSAPTEASQKSFWWLLRELGRCTSASEFDDAAAFLASEIDSRDEARSFDRLFGGKRNVCMRNFMSVSAPRAYIRGALAEGMYERINAKGSVPVIAASTDAAPVTDLHGFARCYLEVDAAAAHALLTETRLGTDEERDAVRAMAGRFGVCLPQGVEVKISAPEVRMALAEALYHAASGTNLDGTEQ